MVIVLVYLIFVSSVNIAKLILLIHKFENLGDSSHSFYEKRSRRRKKNLKKIMMFIVATNDVASRLPERRPTGTPHARANLFTYLLI